MDKINTFIALDIEATGISPNKSRIIEIDNDIVIAILVIPFTPILGKI